MESQDTMKLHQSTFKDETQSTHRDKDLAAMKLSRDKTSGETRNAGQTRSQTLLNTVATPLTKDAKEVSSALLKPTSGKSNVPLALSKVVDQPDLCYDPKEKTEEDRKKLTPYFSPIRRPLTSKIQTNAREIT